MSSRKISPAQWAGLKRDPELKADLALVERVAKQVQNKGGRAYLVGGFVRDLLLGKVSKDLDVEVHGLELSELQKLLKNPKSVGKSFGVFKVGRVDFALARKDSKAAWGEGRKPVVVHDKNLTLDQASRRRDITINALYLDPLTLEILDPQNGLKDLKAKILHHVDAARFGDDPLRVLRLMQFAGRFGFKIHPQTIKLCRKINLKRLSRERVGEEWNKLVLKSPKPSIGLKVAKQLGILKQLHPELEKMPAKNFQRAISSLDKIAGSKTLAYACLCYLLEDENRVQNFLDQIDYPKSARPELRSLIQALKALKRNFSDYELRKQAFDLGKYGSNLGQVSLLAKALGLTKLSDKIKNRARQLKIFQSAPQLLIQGKNLIEFGYKPGPEFSKILEKLADKQWKGELKDKQAALRFIVDKK